MSFVLSGLTLWGGFLGFVAGSSPQAFIGRRFETGVE